MQPITFTITINSILTLILLVLGLFAYLGFAAFSFFQKTVLKLEDAVLVLQTQSVARDKECDALKLIINQLEEQNLNDLSIETIKKVENLNPEILKIVIWCLFIIITVFAFYFAFDFIFKKTILGSISLSFDRAKRAYFRCARSIRK